jgi:hypothetical protein
MQKRFVRSVCALGVFGAASAFASTATPLPIPLVAGNWLASGNASFIAKEAFPQGILQVTSESEEGFVALKDQHFDNGTIEFDIKPVGEEMPGIRFHQNDGDTADMLYIRVSPDCPASQDCLQYVPIIKGRVLWDVYPQYQASAPFRENEWNHIRLVISGKRMNVYVNGRTEPSLRVAHLEGDASTGTIAFEGTAYYANLTLAPGVTDGLDPKAPVDLAAGDRRYLVRWQDTRSRIDGHHGPSQPVEHAIVRFALVACHGRLRRPYQFEPISRANAETRASASDLASHHGAIRPRTGSARGRRLAA